MKNSSENNFRFVKPVFSALKSNLQKYSKYTLGEDYYSLIVEDKELKTNDISKFKVSVE